MCLLKPLMPGTGCTGYNGWDIATLFKTLTRNFSQMCPVDKRNFEVPVCTRSPICRRDIVCDWPFSRETLAVDGKHDIAKRAIVTRI